MGRRPDPRSRFCAVRPRQHGRMDVQRREFQVVGVGLTGQSVPARARLGVVRPHAAPQIGRRQSLDRRRRDDGAEGAQRDRDGVVDRRRLRPDELAPCLPQPSHPTTVPKMLHLRVIAPAGLGDPVIEALTDNPGVAHLVVHRGAAMDPPGDEITADIAREAANEVIEDLKALNVKERGAITWTSSTPSCRRGLIVPRRKPPVIRPTRWYGTNW